MLTNSYWHYPQALTNSELTYLQQVAHDGLQHSVPGIHFGKDPERRSSDIAWSYDPRTLQIASSLIYEANRNAGWRFNITHPEAAQLTQYFIGGQYDWHTDGNSDTHATRSWADIEDGETIPLNMTRTPELVGKVRRLSLTINLSDPKDYEGGELEIDLGQNQTQQLKGQAGSAVVFPSHVRHKVTPVTKGDRTSIVLWMNGPPLS